MFTPLRLVALCALSFSFLMADVCHGQTVERVSVDSIGVEGDSTMWYPAISADGRYVAFQTDASNMVPSDNNAEDDCFVHDRQTGVTERVSVSSNGVEGNTRSRNPSISEDGRYVAFDSYAYNLVSNDTNIAFDIFVHDRLTDVTELVSKDSFYIQGNGRSTFPAISTDGRYVAFESEANNLVPGDTNSKVDIFVRDLQADVTERVSVDSFGIEGNHDSTYASISADGRFVAFESYASNLVSGDTNAERDCFIHDRQTGVTERVSVDSFGTEGNSHSGNTSLSADGRYVAFESYANNLVPGDSNIADDCFVHDRQTGITERVSVNSQGDHGINASGAPSISTNGRYVAFKSFAYNLVPGDTNGANDCFVHDRQTGVTERVSVDSLGAQGNDYCTDPSISADGRLVAFSSLATNLVPNDTNGLTDIFVHDRWDGLGENSIYLSGPTSVPVLSSMSLTWQCSRGGSPYWLLYSTNANGAVVRGHNFDIGNPLKVLANGSHSTNGLGAFTSGPVPPSMAGLTVYFEVAARDASGVLYDSNLLAVDFL